MKQQDRTSAGRHRLFRRSLLLPAEHGSWSWLLVPFLTGVAVAGRLNFAVLLVLVGSLTAFLVRQPATAWLRIRQGRGRRSDASLAAGWTLGLGLLALLALAGLLALGQEHLLLLLLPLLPLLAVYLYIAQRHRARVRSLGMEVAGAAGLAVSSPAAYAAVTGSLDRTAWLLWLLLGLLNGLGVLYVRRRLADNKGQPGSRILVLLAHAAGLLLVAFLVAARFVPWPALLPFAALLLRALWLAPVPRPVANVKRFGFTEVAVELLSGLFVVVAYWLV